MKTMSDLMTSIIEVKEKQQISQSQIYNKPQQAPAINPNIADDALIVDGINLLKVAFPQNDISFWRLLYQRVKAKRMTRNAYVNAVNHCLDNYPYSRLTIASVLGVQY